MNTEDTTHHKLTAFQLLLLLLSIYVLGALLVETTCHLTAETTQLLRFLDTAICVVFLGDFFYRFYHAPKRLAFLKWGWIDFISSIPMLDTFRWGRLVRVIRLLRILRGLRSVRLILRLLLESGAKGTLWMIATIAAVLITFCSIAILNVENVPDSNIKTVGDALWWAITTITTVGYGDKFPITVEGRIVASVLMVAGVGLFGAFTAAIASLLLHKPKADQQLADPVAEEIRLMRLHLARLEERLTPDEVALPAQFGRQQAAGSPREQP